MLGTRHEEYSSFTNGLPFVFNANIERSSFNLSKETNWHDNLEIQLCTLGEGTVLLDGKRFEFNKDDVVVVNSNVIHYTGTDTQVSYSCLIISTDFCKQIGLDPNYIVFEPCIKSATLVKLITDLAKVYSTPNISCYIAKLNKIVLQILIELAENHTLKEINTQPVSQKNEIIKSAISYIRDNYMHKITLDDISKAVLCDKFALCREFKKTTGQTIVENLNNYRCIKAIEYLSAEYTVAQTAAFCGFDNLSFFTKTFKRFIGKLPSDYKKQTIR